MLKALNSDDPDKYMDSIKIYSRKIKLKIIRLKQEGHHIMYHKYRNNKFFKLLLMIG